MSKKIFHFVRYFFLTVFVCSFSPQLFTGLNFANQNSSIRLRNATSKLKLNTPLAGFDGTLTLADPAASIEGLAASDVITFIGGILQTGANKLIFDGIYDPTGSDEIVLDTLHTLDIEGGMVEKTVRVTGVSNWLRGQPHFTTPLILNNAVAELNISISNKLTQNVIMNGGKLILQNDLGFQDNVILDGNGIVDVNNMTLNLPANSAGPWTNTLTFLRANDINLTGPTSLDGSWSFSGAADSSRISGHGNILDISGGGSIDVGPNHTLKISDVHIKGLGAGGGNLNIDATSEVCLSNVTLELAGSYSLLSGTIRIAGDNCRLIARNFDKLFVIGSTSVLAVDGVSFLFDYLATVPGYITPFEVDLGGTIVYPNDGIIRDATSGGATAGPPTPTSTAGPLMFDLASSSGENELDSSFTLNLSSSITFNNATTLVSKDMIFNGNGNILQFNYDFGAYFVLSENVTLTFKNIYLRDFDLAKFDLQGIGATEAKIFFGDNVVLAFSKDMTVNTTPWDFIGNNSVVDGNGNTLTLQSANALSLTGNNSLCLKNLKIETHDANAIKLSSDTSILKMQNSLLQMDINGLVFDNGNLQIKDKTIFSGGDDAVAGDNSIFSFQTKGSLNILSGSTLLLQKSVTFDYDVDITSDGGDAAISKRHVMLDNLSSKLFLDGSTINTGTMGFALDHGTMYIDDKVTFNTNSTVGAEIEIGSALQAEVLAGASLEVNGAMLYTATTFP